MIEEHFLALRHALGLPSSGRRRDKALTLRVIPATSLFLLLT
jgi:hypothetical protein